MRDRRDRLHHNRDAEQREEIARKRREAADEPWRREAEVRRAQDSPDEQLERTIKSIRQGPALIGSTDALERFDAKRAPEER